jgi:periplasmic glucans biosynthesis protein
MQRSVLAAVFGALVSTAFLGASPVRAFGFEDVTAWARQAAATAYQAPVDRLPAGLSSLGYDALRDIRYRPAKAIWRDQGLPFEIQFFHLGGGSRVPVAMFEVHQGRVWPLQYDPTAWSFGASKGQVSTFTGVSGHAGLRVHHALNDPAYKDELVAFLGASYFRALGRGQQYGLSARGLAIDTVGAPAGAAEEFPYFKAFWVERPARDAKALTVLALLDSPRATGAYRFVLRPGQTTQVDVQARLFMRKGAAPVRTLGIAPLSSMFQHGPTQPRASDFRPQVHDSDGLLVVGRAAGPGGSEERLWRPLFNPPRPLASSFALQRLTGFGLLQRERRFARFEDTEARYDRRPSAWVEPIGDWGPGRVELLMLPTPDETHDNITAYWVPATLPAPGQALELAWRLHWVGDPEATPLEAGGLGVTVQSRRGFGLVDAARPPPAGEMQWQIDFDGAALRALPPGATVQADATAAAVAGRPAAQVLEARADPHPLGGTRLHLRVMRNDPTQPVELRAQLRHAGVALTETWTALIPQEQP